MNKKYKMSRRQLVKRFGVLGFLLHPVLRTMTASAGTSQPSQSPRFILIMKGGGFQPAQVSSITSPLAMRGTPFEPLEASGGNLVLFKNMHITGGDTYGGSEEHGCGLYGCLTGDITKYQPGKSDSYFAYTDNESIDSRIAREYASNSATKSVIDQLVIGGSYSDSDSTGLGQKYFSFKTRTPGQIGFYANANPSIEDPAILYDLLMRKISQICIASSNQPKTQQSKFNSTASRQKALLGFQIQDLKDAKTQLGLDTEHAQKLDGLLAGWSDLEQGIQENRQTESSEEGSSIRMLGNCPNVSRPVGQTGNKLSTIYRSGNLDNISVYHDYFAQLLQLAFQWDLTRVVAYSLAAPSNGQNLPSKGVHSIHHSLEHAGDNAKLSLVDRYYAEKMQGLFATLNNVKDPDGKSILHNSIAVQVSECWSNGNNTVNGDGDHSQRNVPFILAGQAGGRIQTGRVVDAKGRSINDLWLTCLGACGVSATTFGASRYCAGPIV